MAKVGIIELDEIRPAASTISSSGISLGSELTDGALLTLGCNDMEELSVSTSDGVELGEDEIEGAGDSEGRFEGLMLSVGPVVGLSDGV